MVYRLFIPGHIPVADDNVDSGAVFPYAYSLMIRYVVSGGTGLHRLSHDHFRFFGGYVFRGEVAELLL
jgi:hypothetical protein